MEQLLIEAGTPAEAGEADASSEDARVKSLYLDVRDYHAYLFIY